MIGNYLAVAIRSLSRDRLFSLINILGLSLGIACALVITLFVLDELSFDRHHEKADRIHRVILDAKLMGKEIQGPISPAPMAAAIRAEIPEVETAVRLWRRSDVVVARGADTFTEDVYYADPEYFEVFTHPLLEGDPATALVEPNSIVLVQRAAKRLFGEHHALGETVTVNGTDFKVTGVADDIPYNSHLLLDYLVSMSSRTPNREDEVWVSNNFRTYLVAREGASPEKIEDKLNAIVRRYAAPQIKTFLKVTMEVFEEQGGRYRFHLQPLTDVYLRSDFPFGMERNGDIDTVYMFASIAVLIVLVACVNYTNLTTARASRRSVEIGIRKAVGAERGHLLRQFLGESILTTAAAAFIAVFLAELALPALSGFLDKPLSLARFDGWQFLAAVLMVPLVGVAAGAYPAFVLSAFRPQAVLKGGGKSAGRGLLRSALVVFQFVVCVALVVGTIVVNEQMRFVRSKNLGFEKERTLVLHRAWPVRQKFDAFRESLTRDPRILAVSGSSDVPGRWFNNSAFMPEDAPAGQSYLLWRLSVDEDFVETMGLAVAEGRGFSRAFPSDTSAVLVNRTAAALMGWDEPIGKRIRHPGVRQDQPTTYTVVGVLEDFHFQTLRETIRPLIVQHVGHSETNNVNNVVIRFKTDDLASLLESVEAAWTAIRSDQPFIYSFLDDDLETLYAADRKVAQIAGGFSVLAILIGCLGLFGLTSFTTAQRTKEIGIRKVLGASEGSVVRMLSTDVIRFVLIGNAIAWPIAYVVMEQWLQSFAYRTTLGVGPFAAGGLVALAVSLATVSVLTVRAARSNPVEALRYE